MLKKIIVRAETITNYYGT